MHACMHTVVWAGFKDFKSGGGPLVHPAHRCRRPCVCVCVCVCMCVYVCVSVCVLKLDIGPKYSNPNLTLTYCAVSPHKTFLIR